MEAPTYADFDLRIDRMGRRYRILVSSKAGEASAEVSRPLISKNALQLLLLQIGRPRRDVRRIDSPRMYEARAFGERLFNKVFQGEIRARLASSLDDARQHGTGLRIRLRVPPELADLPWEYLYDGRQFLGLSTTTPVVRYMDLARVIEPLAVGPPLKILLVVASPGKYAALNTAEEARLLRAALRPLEERNLVTVAAMEHATVDNLRRELRRGTYHIFHFMGHGVYDQARDDGLLLLEDEFGEEWRITGEELGLLLQDHWSLRLVVLNSCEGARGSARDPFSGAAQSLVTTGIPAVIAMQFEITDEAAIRFSSVFYEAVADGYPVDAALSDSRRAIRLSGNEVEWGTPVLYMRSPDGHVFQVAQGAPEDVVREEAEQRAEEEADQRAKEEAKQLAKEEAEQRAEEEAEQRAETRQRKSPRKPDAAPTAKAAPAKRPTAKAAPAKRPTAKAAPAKRSTAKAAPAKRPTAKAAPAKRPTAKAAPAKRPTAKAAPAKRSTAKAAPGKRSTAKAPAKRPIVKRRMLPSPFDPWNAGMRLQAKGDFEGAKKAYQVVIANDPERMAKASNRLGIVLKAQGDMEGARKAYQRAIDSGRPDVVPVAAWNLGLLLHGEGDMDGAKRAYRVAIESQDPEWGAKASYRLGSLLKREGDTEGARKAFQRAVDSGRPDVVPIAAYLLGVLLVSTLDQEGAKRAYRMAIETRDPKWAPKASLLLGGLLATHGDMRGAIHAYRSAMESGRPDVVPAAARNLGGLLANQGDVDGATRAYQVAVDSKDPRWGPKAATELAQLFLREGDHSGYLRTIQQAAAAGFPVLPETSQKKRWWQR